MTTSQARVGQDPGRHCTISEGFWNHLGEEGFIQYSEPDVDAGRAGCGGEGVVLRSAGKGAGGCWEVKWVRVSRAQEGGQGGWYSLILGHGG